MTPSDQAPRPDSQDVLLLPASKQRAAQILLACVGFLVLGLWLKSEQPIVGWLTIVGCGAGIPIATSMLVTDRFYLRLDSDGLEMGGLTKPFRAAWGEVDGFEIVTLNRTRMIAIHFNEDHQRQRLLRGAVKEFTGVEGAIPNSYGVPLEEVLARLQEWHRRFSRLSV